MTLTVPFNTSLPVRMSPTIAWIKLEILLGVPYLQRQPLHSANLQGLRREQLPPRSGHQALLNLRFPLLGLQVSRVPLASLQLLPKVAHLVSLLLSVEEVRLGSLLSGKPPLANLQHPHRLADLASPLR